MYLKLLFNTLLLCSEIFFNELKHRIVIISIANEFQFKTATGKLFKVICLAAGWLTGCCNTATKQQKTVATTKTE